jgi:hypothetical protein
MRYFQLLEDVFLLGRSDIFDTLRDVCFGPTAEREGTSSGGINSNSRNSSNSSYSSSSSSRSNLAQGVTQKIQDLCLDLAQRSNANTNTTSNSTSTSTNTNSSSNSSTRPIEAWCEFRSHSESTTAHNNITSPSSTPTPTPTPSPSPTPPSHLLLRLVAGVRVGLDLPWPLNHFLQVSVVNLM